MPINKLGTGSPSNWQDLETAQRCRIIGDVASHIAADSQNLIDLCASPWRVDPVETITAELFPLCGAMQWIGRRGPKVLTEKVHGVLGRPAWLWGVQSRVRRVPIGKVLILSAWNYPIFLPGVQTAQALAAGNTVLLKPAPGCEAVTSALVASFYAAGVSTDALTQLDSDAESAKSAMKQGVDLVVLTGGASTGKAVMQQAAETLTPTIMELSGCDSVIVHPRGDLDRAARAIAFGMRLSSGATCIAPRRVFAEPATADELRDLIMFHLREYAGGNTSEENQPMHVHSSSRVAAADAIENAIQSGAVDVMGQFDGNKLRDCGEMSPTLLDQVCSDFDVACSDLFAPVTSLIRVDHIKDCVAIVNESKYRLSASVFAPDDIAHVISEQIAERLQVGSVAINDLIVPTADPRVPFGGRGNSGFGVTRGEEGLLAMTAAQVIGHHHGNFLPHLRKRQTGDAKTLQAALSATYSSGWKDRLAAVRRMAGKG
ncbi:aldehyde dehydrogenase family protein [Rubripirellula obstinata]|uniref:aldehyde dehydrogenase family protein n=1 Tax=Rubripirellula obstinata TaxID=406547 RepID=UPI001F398A8C|nr:aldehyde dehydrogenase family protein [Rubripirellula obstinata]